MLFLVVLNVKLLRTKFCKFTLPSIIHLSSSGSTSRKIDSVLVSSILDANLNSPSLFLYTHIRKEQCAVSSSHLDFRCTSSILVSSVSIFISKKPFLSSVLSLKKTLERFYAKKVLMQYLLL